MVSQRGFTTTDGIDLNEILYGTVLPIIDLYNAEEVLDLRSLLTVDGDESYFKFDASGKWKFQKLAEGEKPASRKKEYGKKQKDTEKYGLDIDYTFDWLMSDMSSSSEIASLASKAIDRDRALQTAIILETALQSSTDGFWNGAYTADEKITTPPTWGTNTFTAAHTHYVASGSATLSLTDITAAKQTIKEQGFNGGVIGFANSDFMQKVEDLAGFNIAGASNQLLIQSPITDRVAVDGFRGRLLGVDWIETEWMPDDYFMLIGSRNGQMQPIRFIQKKNPSAHGLLLMPGGYDPRYPIIDATYIHWLSAQVLWRGAGVVYQLTAGAFTNPTITTNVVE
jgi:hypothetical protein